MRRRSLGHHATVMAGWDAVHELAALASGHFTFTRMAERLRSSWALALLARMLVGLESARRTNHVAPSGGVLMREYRRPVIAAIVSVGAILASTLSATASELPSAAPGGLSGSDTPRLLDDVYAEVARQVPGFAGIQFDGSDTVRVLLTTPDQRKAETPSSASWMSAKSRGGTMSLRQSYM